tara:strand:- start:8405 stop:8623 length:219 start_codon:yes stop_codon:yes gene_type:complete
MKIYEVIAEGPIKSGMGSGVNTSTVKGVNKASKPKPVIKTKAKATQDYTSRAPVKLSPSITRKNYNNAMARA